MTQDQESTSVGEMVVNRPELMKVFDRLGIDYCCAGDKSLSDACAHAGVSPAEAEEKISQVQRVADGDSGDGWTDLNMLGLVDHIEATHHRYLDEEMPRLSSLADKVVAAHGNNHQELARIAKILSAFIADMGPHLMKEERVLFPMVRQLAIATEPTSFHCGSIGNPIQMMRYEHVQVGEMLADMRRLSNDYLVPEDGCASYRAFYEGLAALESDTHLHIHKENNILFPSVLECEGKLSEITPM